MQRMMTRKAPAPAARKKRAHAAPAGKRSRGRPRTGREAVGRDAIVSAARQLLENLPPHKVPTVLIARKAGVDPALVRYYFSNREELLIAVIEHILGTWAARHPLPDAPPAQQLSAHIAGMFDFSCRVRSMQRLMIDGCAEAKSPAVRARVRELNADAVRHYAQFLHLEGEEAEASPDPLFMHVAIIGLCEFFAAAQAMILPLAPQHLSAAELAQPLQDVHSQAGTGWPAVSGGACRQSQGRRLELVVFLHRLAREVPIHVRADRAFELGVQPRHVGGHPIRVGPARVMAQIQLRRGAPGTDPSVVAATSLPQQEGQVITHVLGDPTCRPPGRVPAPASPRPGPVTVCRTP